MPDDTTRWTVSVSKDTDIAVRSFLAKQPAVFEGREGDFARRGLSAAGRHIAATSILWLGLDV